MPRESTRQTTRQEAVSTNLEIRVTHKERTVRVALSGILDRAGVNALAGRVAPGLAGRGCRIILDGSGLSHMDYRATRSLIAWHRRLRRRGQSLYLQGWSDYLKAILVMEDWDCDRSLVPNGLPTLRHLGDLTDLQLRAHRVLLFGSEMSSTHAKPGIGRSAKPTWRSPAARHRSASPPANAAFWVPAKRRAPRSFAESWRRWRCG